MDLSENPGDLSETGKHGKEPCVAFNRDVSPSSERRYGDLGTDTVKLLTNLPSDWDSGVLYEQEAYELVTAYLLEEAGLRRAACAAAFEAAAEYETWSSSEPDDFTGKAATSEECIRILARRMYGDVPYAARWLPALCRDREQIPYLIRLLEHTNGWFRINAAKALMHLEAETAVEPMARMLKQSRPDAEYGYSGVLEHAEYNSPTPRWREAFIRGLGRLGAVEYDQMLIDLMRDSRNVVDIQYAAALALDELGTAAALSAFATTNRDHQFHSVRMVAREALWRRGMLAKSPDAHTSGESASSEVDAEPEAAAGIPDAIVFIQGDNDCGSDFNGQAGVDPWRQTYSITNSGPAYRRGHNLFLLKPVRPDGQVIPLTRFVDGQVADCEVSWDAKRIVFARRANGDSRNYREVPYAPAVLKGPDEPLWDGSDDPWWHIWEINVDGTGLRQLTFGPFHDVGPAYLPDGRIVFTSSRLGLRDEYHGYPSTGLSVMNGDGSDIHVIGFNLGGNREPAVLNDGRIVFSRLDNFYSRLKTGGCPIAS